MSNRKGKDKETGSYAGASEWSQWQWNAEQGSYYRYRLNSNGELNPPQ